MPWNERNEMVGSEPEVEWERVSEECGRNEEIGAVGSEPGKSGNGWQRNMAG